MDRLNRITGVIAMTGLVGGLAAVAISAAFAQTNAPPAPSDQGGMMQHGMPNGQGMMPGMMMNEEMQQKMVRMMDNCNSMMETMMQNKGTTTTPPASPNKS
jgi:Spy/CpxP family protein refolding chaperone